ncbi:MAG TPA: SpoIVB peptidase S55 domain-containing protein [Patescibacteria group bacterium]|nr:SpoIVB peptidase S55 domain-containing protein [Patescibacteria group bacterium]
MRRLFFLSIAVSAALVLATLSSAAAGPQIFPLARIKPGMNGVGYTIFSGDKIQPFDVQIVGILPNLIGPKQDVVLVKLSSPEIAKSGVVAGMSGSPVYIDGKLAGAISYKFGMFTSEAIAGMTPIEEELAVDGQDEPAPGRVAKKPSQASTRLALPRGWAEQVGVGNGEYLEPIASPVVFSGFLPSVIGRYSSQLERYGMVATEGGSVPASPADAELKPGDMAGMVLISGDLSMAAGCTVTARIGDRVYLCGHPLFGFGNVHIPMARGHVVATLASSMSSTKIMNTGGVIGSITEDRLTGVMGRIGPPPPMIPVELSVGAGASAKQFHFNVMENAKLTPLLVAMATLEGVRSNLTYNEGTTFQLEGSIDIAGHNAVRLDNMFAPSNAPIPDASPIASQVEGVFAEIFDNPYEQPHITAIHLTVRSLPDARWASIESAWSDAKQVHPGETVTIKVAMQPYRGAPFIRDVPISIPLQASPGPLHVLVSDAGTLDRIEQYFPFGQRGRVGGLDQLIELLNQERRNDRLYVALLQTGPTLLFQDKRLPNIPLSEINVLGQRNPGQATVLWQSELAERSVAMHEVITGNQYLSITVK